jgi:Tol biopolymer transport system component
MQKGLKKMTKGSATCVACGLVLLGLLVTACVQLSTNEPLQPLSPLVSVETSTPDPTSLMAPPVGPTSVVVSPLATPTPLPTATLTSPALPSETVTVRSIWRAVDSGTEYALYQFTETSLGVVSLDWSPDGEHLWVNVAAETGGMGGIARTTSFVVNLNSHRGWRAGQWGDYLGCSSAHAWSPDGRQLAYVQDGRVWMAGADGQNPRPLPLPDGAAGVRDPSYSPDGHMIAMLGGRIVSGSVKTDLWVMDVTTGVYTPVIQDADDGRYVWSPTGRALALLSEETASETYPIGAARLWIADLEGRKTVFADISPLPGTEGCFSPPAWLLGGEKVLASVLLMPGVWIMDLTGEVERLDESAQGQGGIRARGVAAPSGGVCDKAVASPDGRYVVYTSGSNALYLLDPVSNTRLSLGDGNLCYGGTRITWSPTEARFLRWGETLPLEVVQATDGRVHPLAASGLWPAWSPNGQRVAFWRPEAEGYSLWLYDFDDMKMTRLTSSGLDDPWQRRRTTPFVYDIEPRWSPDGESIAFVSFREEHPEAHWLHLP